jgi:hypothetical protein
MPACRLTERTEKLLIMYATGRESPFAVYGRCNVFIAASGEKTGIIRF